MRYQRYTPQRSRASLGLEENRTGVDFVQTLHTCHRHLGLCRSAVWFYRGQGKAYSTLRKNAERGGVRTGTGDISAHQCHCCGGSSGWHQWSIGEKVNSTDKCIGFRSCRERPARWETGGDGSDPHPSGCHQGLRGNVSKNARRDVLPPGSGREPPCASVG